MTIDIDRLRGNQALNYVTVLSSKLDVPLTQASPTCHFSIEHSVLLVGLPQSHFRSSSSDSRRIVIAGKVTEHGIEAGYPPSSRAG